ncbi:MAG: tRNA (guanosine(37)-N1)-methyltransferase TrmD [Endomicrobiia bacterium]
MRIDVITIFPEMFNGFINTSIIGKAQKNGYITIKIHNLRDYTTDKHKQVDDKPFGGGPGMVVKPEPIYNAIKKFLKKKSEREIIFLTPQGEIFTQEIAKTLSAKKHLILICGRYEGVDERIMKFVDRQISIGDYVLTGGEVPAMVIIDAVARLIPGVVKEKDSVIYDSFFDGLLDYPHYTRPRIFKKMKVPDVLLSGNHSEIRKWRLKQSLRNTLLKRKDLLKKRKLTEEEKNLLKEIKLELKKERKNEFRFN